MASRTGGIFACSASLPENSGGLSAVSPTLQALGLFALALLVRLLGNASQPVHVDEFYHLLAGQSWADHGRLSILDGVYTRARGYTMLTGLVFLALDHSSMFIARIPSLLSGALLVPAVFLWTRRTFSLRVAWIAGLLLCFADIALEVSQFARFYALHALFVWFGSVAVYRALEPRRSLRAAFLSLGWSAICFLIALHLQVTTVIHVAGVGVFVAGVLATRPPVRGILEERRYWPWLAAAALLLVVIGFVAMRNFSIVERFRDTSYWALESKDDVLFYLQIFLDRLLILSLLLPLALWLVVVRRWRAGLFCLALFIVPFVAHSLAGMKSFRYLFYALPFFFILTAVAIDFLLAKLSQGLASLMAGWGERHGGAFGPPALATIIGSAAFLAGAAAIVGNRAEAHGLKRLAVDAYRVARAPASLFAEPPDKPWTKVSPNWSAVIGSPSLLVVADDVRTLHYLGRPFDVLINRSRITDISPAVEFGRDFRTGRRVIGQGRTLARVASCYADGVIVVPDDRWAFDFAVPANVTRAIERIAAPIQPGVKGFHLYRWQHPVHGEDCAEIRAEIASHSAS